MCEITPGVSTDREASELFVALSGRTTFEVEDGPALDLPPSVVGCVPAGARTAWRVHETLAHDLRRGVTRVRAVVPRHGA